MLKKGKEQESTLNVKKTVKIDVKHPAYIVSMFIRGFCMHQWCNAALYLA